MCFNFYNSIKLAVSDWGSTSMYGTPIRVSNLLHSSLCCLVTFTSRLLNLSMFSCSPVRIFGIRIYFKELLSRKQAVLKVSVPASCAWARSFSASALLSPLFSSCKNKNKNICRQKFYPITHLIKITNLNIMWK